MAYTAGDQINRALRLIGVLAEGEQPSAETSADALMALNQMIDSWNTERLSVFSTLEQIYVWPTGQANRLLGPSGDFVGDRPVVLDESTYYVYNGLSFPLEFINQLQYDSIALKSASSTLPSVMFVNSSFPDISMYLYPVPSVDLEMHFISVEPLTQPADLTTNLFFPPGYLRAFTYNLAIELAPEFGVSAPQDVKDIAKASKRNLKRINNPGDVMGMPAALLPRRYGYNIYTGQ